MLKYAIIKSGGKQIKVNVGSAIWVEKLNSEIGSEYIFTNVLAIYDGQNLIAGTPKIDAKIKARIQKQGKNKKLIIFRTKQKSNWKRKQGHRQPYTRLLVEEIIYKDQVIDKYIDNNDDKKNKIKEITTNQKLIEKKIDQSDLKKADKIKTNDIDQKQKDQK
ncbi:50S ribosomal protein L21 [Candidatus Hepatoplasma crinochetorum Av]|uniref:Large ribosomal subunit protein bL21 n=1 Tax=Candidatus Hepatoplasma crinochetorum Av TaxID=1427984 RepID=W8GF80_9MOLU|nr:50S ribosomal protein L21 [Candidatus Hepatoplasma crinochetorum]AHK22409.1 50S ribosomal protein L21 [Candidatus Hepatoplasma crinochetorum Av]